MKSAIFILIFLSLQGFAQQTQTGREWIEKSLKSRANNDPEIKFPNFQYQSYQNLKISGDPEALTGPGYKKTELRKTLKQTGVFYTEKTSLFIKNQDLVKREVITGINMSGFEKPVYPIYTINFQSQNVYEQDYTILDQRFLNPISEQGLSTYDYHIAKDTVINSRSTIKINVDHEMDNKPNLLKGSFYIDQSTAAVVKAQFTNFGSLNIVANHDLIFDEDLEVWTTYYQDLFIKKEKTKKEFELFGARLEIGNEKPKEITAPSDDLYVIMRTYNRNFKNEVTSSYLNLGARIEVLEEATKKDKDYWNKFRDTDKFSNDDLASFMQLDSVITATRVTRKLETLDKFKIGYYPVGFFDFDLKYLVKYNDYEAFRLGAGGTTNEKLSEQWRLGGYLAYGTKDRTFKYKFSVGYRLNESKNTWLSMYRQDDITEFAAESFLTDARVYSLFEPRLINIPTFYLFKEHGLSLQQRPVANIIGEFSLSRKRILQTTSYKFLINDEVFSEYVLSEAKVGIRWSPKGDFMRTPSGYQTIKKGYPVFSGQATKGFSNLIDSDFDYWKLSGKVSYVIQNSTDHATDIMVEGHYASGEVPLTHLFHAYPNAPTKDEILQRFSVAGRRSFETMFFNEFFSDRIAVAQVRHQFPAFEIASFLKPELVLTSRFAIGNLNDKQQHLNVNFDTLEHGYLESGFELNKLIFGFGLSASYRYGAYHLPDIEDNIALKFTFDLEL
ncbi:MAG: DUF5686 family protein [Nonlabens sp.]